jgi:hypothetical protein
MAISNETHSEPHRRSIIPEEKVPLPDGGVELKKGTFVQRAGLWLAAGVGGVTAVVTICLVIFLYRHFPEMPTAQALNGPGAQNGNTQYTIEQYQQLSDIAVKSTQEIFQTIVAQVLIPVFTAILGYIFGRGSRTGESD